MLVFMLAAQAAIANGNPGSETTAKPKPKQICERIEVTGSRAKQLVCRDSEGNLDLGPGVKDSVGTSAQFSGVGTPPLAPSAPH